MALSALETLKLIAPPFAGLGDATLEQWIALAVPSLDVRVFGDKYITALAYYAAALIAVSGAPGGIQANGAVASPVTGRRAGEVAVQYAQVQLPAGSAENWLRLSSYGGVYLSIRAQCVGNKPLTSNTRINWL